VKKELRTRLLALRQDETIRNKAFSKLTKIAFKLYWYVSSVPDPPHLDADPDPDPAYHLDPDPTFHYNADPDSCFRIKAQNLEKVLK
jgi:hypothetical protein